LLEDGTTLSGALAPLLSFHLLAHALPAA